MPYKTLNREYKFRAWMNDHMIYSELNLDKESEILDDDSWSHFWDIAEGHDKMQYIGLKDLNNKEIYEEDIDKAFGVIIMDYGCFIGRAFALSEEGEEEKIDTILGHTSQNQREIIGNIYENPELINDKVGNAI